MTTVFIVAGEASGDLHAANLLQALHNLEPGIEAFGVGGERLREARLDCVAHSEELSVMGLAEVVRDLPRLWRLSRRVREAALERRPQVAVLVDSPDFNLPLARHLRRAGIPVVIYISPQLWAWRAGRVRRIRRDVHRVLCILPFEVEFYRRHRVPAQFVGHPLVDELVPVMRDLPRRVPHALALLPGSRWHEVRSLLPEMLAAAARLGAAIPDLTVRLIVAPGLDVDRVRDSLGSAAVELVISGRHRSLAACSAALVASGTATLECALLGVPMVVGYRLHPASYLMARFLVRVPHVALVNLVAGERVVPELVQDAFTAEALAREAGALLAGAGESQRVGLAEVQRRLGEAGASERAARAVLDVARRDG
ncbi:MAG TPA: lipid-A-disaccharide synthase [Thermoanaerobaculaceae bacterium]|nr:lipid-A-disaccharide synthase [Thermoanaerobaculaceae bacterium]